MAGLDEGDGRCCPILCNALCGWMLRAVKRSAVCDFVCGWTVSGPVRSVQRSGRCSFGEPFNSNCDPAPSGCTVVIADSGARHCGAALLERFLAVALLHRVGRARYRARRVRNHKLAVDILLTPIISGLAELRVKAGTDGSGTDRRGCGPAHRRRVCVCRRAWRRRYPAEAGGRDRAAVRRAIPPGTAPEAGAIAETASPTGMSFASDFCNKIGF